MTMLLTYCSMIKLIFGVVAVVRIVGVVIVVCVITQFSSCSMRSWCS